MSRNAEFQQPETVRARTGSIGSASSWVSMARKAGAATGLEKSEKRGVQAARNGPSEDGKWWQRVELGIHGLRAGAATGLEKSEKRGVQGAPEGHSELSS